MEPNDVYLFFMQAKHLIEKVTAILERLLCKMIINKYEIQIQSKNLKTNRLKPNNEGKGLYFLIKVLSAPQKKI